MKGVERIPDIGPAIVVGNHRSYFDPLAMSVVFARSGRTVRFLGKKEVFDVPVVGQLATAMGGIRVDRGTGSDEPLEAAAGALAGGEVGDHAAGHDPPRRGVLRPRAEGALGRSPTRRVDGPVIPIGLWGTEKVWPRSSRLPNVLNVSNPPEVRIRGPPVELKYRSSTPTPSAS